MDAGCVFTSNAETTQGLVTTPANVETTETTQGLVTTPANVETTGHVESGEYAALKSG